MKNDKLVGRQGKRFPYPPNFYKKGGDNSIMNDFNGKGYPLEDDRLRLSGTTPAGNQQYRIWHDSQQVLVPAGQSTTKVMSQNENVQVNTGVFGKIVRGYFNRPVVEFRNTIDYKLFDRYTLKTWRDAQDFPTDETYLYFRDLENNSLRVAYKVEFENIDGGFIGYDEGITWLEYIGTDTATELEEYVSPILHFDNFSTVGLRGEYVIVTSPTAYSLTKGIQLPTGININDNTKYPTSLVIQKTLIFNGNSEMQLLVKNTNFEVRIKSVQIQLIGGE